jgi:hypothetical protein
MASVDNHAIVVTSDNLSFISAWTTAAILLVEVGATLFFVTGIAEQVLGGGAIWFIVGALAGGFILKSIYFSGEDLVGSETPDFTARNTRIVPQQSWKLPLLLQYLALGPLCCLACGQYIIAGVSVFLTRPITEVQELYGVLLTIAVTVVGWWLSRSGNMRYRQSCARIVQIFTLFAVIQIVWCVVTIATKDSQRLPPIGAFLQSGTQNRLLWLSPVITGSLASFGYGLLFLGSLRTLPRLWRHMSSPKLKNIRIAANVACGYSLIVVGALTVFVSALVPKEFLRSYPGAALLGLSSSLAGWVALRGIFGMLLVSIAILLLVHVTRASFLASTSLLNEIFDSETLMSWLPESIQSHSVISDGSILVGFVYVAAIVIARNGFAAFALLYAFIILIGLWFDTTRAVLLGAGWLESKIETSRGRLARLAILLMLLSCFGLAMALSAPRQALWSLGSVVGLLVAVVSRERWRAKRSRGEHQVDFQLEFSTNLDFPNHAVRPGAVLVAVRDPNRLYHLEAALEKIDTGRYDVVVMTASLVSRSASDFEIADNRSFSGEEQALFQRVTRIAEQYGKTISAFLTVAASDTFRAMVNTAAALNASRLVTSVSATMESETLARLIGRAWERLPEPRSRLSLEITAPARPSLFVNLGPHAPRMWPDDVDRLHALWLELSDGLERLHHSDVISTALRLFEKDLHGVRRQELIQAVSECVGEKHNQEIR